MEKNKDVDLLLYNSKSYLFDGFSKLLKGEKSIEEFMRIGDFVSDDGIFDLNAVSSFEFLKKQDFSAKGYDSSCLIVDNISAKLLKTYPDNFFAKVFYL